MSLKKPNLLLPDDPRFIAVLKGICKGYAILATLWIVLWYALDIHTTSGAFMSQDYHLFWAVSHMTLNGDVMHIYDMPSTFATIRESFPAYKEIITWVYPPTALLLYWPLALLPYFLSWIVYSVSTFAALLVVIRKIVPGPATFWALLATPALQVNGWIGHNGALNAALLGVAFINLEKRPALAGISLGILCYKPQLLPLIFLALLIGGYWKTLFSTALTVCITAGLTTVIFGADIWNQWWQSMSLFMPSHTSNILRYDKITSLYAVAYNMKLNPTLCMVLHLLVALPAAFVAMRIWWNKTVSYDVKIAALVCAILIFTPYLYFYDYAISVVMLAYWIRSAMATGWQKHEYGALCAVWILPAWSALQPGFPFVPLPTIVMCYALYLLYRRAMAQC